MREFSFYQWLAAQVGISTRQRKGPGRMRSAGGPGSIVNRLRVAMLTVLLTGSPIFGATIIVTSTANNTTVNGSVSLREAITSINNGANLNADVVAVGAYGVNDTINFGIPGAGVQTINLILSPPTSSGGLPAITRTIIIDGFSQPGSSFNAPLIEINGTGAAGAISGLDLTNVSNSLIRGLIINRCAGRGILISGAPATNNRIQGNFLGPNNTGTGGFFVFGNTQQEGVVVNGGATGNFIGTDGDGVNDAAEGNLVSGNVFNGISLDAVGTSGNFVAGNRIGTDVTATLSIRNGPATGTGAGLNLGNGASNNIAGTNSDGTSDALEANTISGNNVGITIGNPGTSGNRVQGNFIGTQPGGTAALPNLNDGIAVSGIAPPVGPNGNFIGTNGDGINDAIEGNVISGNSGLGMRLATGSFGNRVSGNKIGTDVTGTIGIPNTFTGLSIESNSPNNVKGTNGDGVSDDLEGNVISATVAGTPGFGNGVAVSGASSSGNRISGNRIGTNDAGTVALPNAARGISVSGGTSTLIGTNGDGTSDTLERNIISGNTGGGIVIFGAATTGVIVAGNYIGTDVNGTGNLGNISAGVFIATSSSGNTVGGTAAGTGNVLAFNNRGVLVGNPVTDLCLNNRILGNSIFDNNNLGIDLGTDGVTMNDTGDPDAGPNNLQNFPMIVSAFTGSTFVNFTLNSSPVTTYRVEFFGNAAIDPSGFGEGQTFLGFMNVATDATGNFTGFFTSAITTPAGQFVTATATDPAGNTSEFSPARIVLAPSAANVTVAGRVTDNSGRPINGVRVLITGVSGVTRVALTNAFGFYRFDEVPSGGSYLIQAAHKRYSFAPRILTVTDEILDANITAEPPRIGVGGVGYMVSAPRRNFKRGDKNGQN